MEQRSSDLGLENEVLKTKLAKLNQEHQALKEKHEITVSNLNEQLKFVTDLAERLYTKFTAFRQKYYQGTVFVPSPSDHELDNNMNWIAPAIRSER